MRNEEMIATVECYIHHRTDKEIRIARPRNSNQFFLLTKAYENCKGFFIKH
jgi:hypothetical protein|tara:strand:- start:542 stop:694 length:153 start_codon:yes stop_codon:yes gene_type:complete